MLVWLFLVGCPFGLGTVDCLLINFFGFAWSFTSFAGALGGCIFGLPASDADGVTTLMGCLTSFLGCDWGLADLGGCGLA